MKCYIPISKVLLTVVLSIFLNYIVCDYFKTCNLVHFMCCIFSTVCLLFVTHCYSFHCSSSYALFHLYCTFIDCLKVLVLVLN